MQLSKNQYVIFSNGEKHDYKQAIWSEKHHAFYTFIEESGIDENGREWTETSCLYSNTIIDRQPKAKSKKDFEPSSTSCTIQILPDSETEKAYCFCVGTNGHIGKSVKAYYEYIAKSICYVDENSNIFAPSWATNNLSFNNFKH